MLVVPGSPGHAGTSAGSARSGTDQVYQTTPAYGLPEPLADPKNAARIRSNAAQTGFPTSTPPEATPMAHPDDRKYTETHEWIQESDGVITIGLTSFAVDQLTDVTFVELKESGTTLNAGDPVGEVESVKTSSDVYSPVDGEIVEVNDALESAPETINSDPYGEGWLVKIKVADAAPLASLMDASSYESSAS